MIKVLLVLLVARTIFGCSSDLDCRLNGMCTNGECFCNPPWTDYDCGKLRMLSVPPIQGYGMVPNITAWGGNVLRDDDGLYHLFVAEMALGCPLQNWQTNSICRHAVSKHIQGPYVPHRIALGVWCHNPQIVKLKDGTFALFHIGEANGGNPVNCTKSGSKFSDLKVAAGSQIHITDNLNGKFLPVTNSTLPGCNNPAPFVASNGTVFIICLTGNLYKSDNGVYGPWRFVTTINITGGPDGIYEDPVLWMDRKNNFHVIYHVYNYNDDHKSCVNVKISAHGYSQDGFNWYFGPNEPFNNHIARTTGETTIVSTRERPKLFFNEDGVETYLFSAVSSAVSCPDGPPTGCVDCKYQSWDYWLAQGLDHSKP